MLINKLGLFSPRQIVLMRFALHYMLMEMWGREVLVFLEKM